LFLTLKKHPIGRMGGVKKTALGWGFIAGKKNKKNFVFFKSCRGKPDFLRKSA
jgi:hypothetical protein